MTSHDTLLLDERADGSTASQARPRRRWVRALAVVTGLVLLLGIGAAAATYAFVEHRISGNLTHQAMLPAQTGAAAGSDPARRASAGDAQNILFIGSDPYDGETRGRSDVMLLAHIPADRSAVQIVHFPRDMYVHIPGRTGRDKLNAAYAYGGAPLLVSTLQQLLGVRVDHVAQTDMEGFAAMIDALGGVDVTVEEASPGFAAGPAHLSGQQALTFVRQRKMLSEGDLSRGKRQQEVLRALMFKALSRQTVSNPVAFASFVDVATRHLTVDETLTTQYLRSEAVKMTSLRADDVRFVTAPLTGFGVTPAGASIDVVDEPGLRRLGEALATDTMADYRP